MYKANGFIRPMANGVNGVQKTHFPFLEFVISISGAFFRFFNENFLSHEVYNTICVEHGLGKRISEGKKERLHRKKTT